METKTKVEKCGCEFTTQINGENSCTFLTKCKCQKHYDEQLVAEWSDHEGHHKEIREPEEVEGLMPLEVDDKIKFQCQKCGTAVDWISGRLYCRRCEMRAGNITEAVDMKCPVCKSENIRINPSRIYTCSDCGHNADKIIFEEEVKM